LKIEADVYRVGMEAGELIEGDAVVHATILSGIVTA
jgi:hypothetical protein